MSFAVIALCVAYQRVFVVVYFVIDSVRKLLDTPSYLDYQLLFKGPVLPISVLSMCRELVLKVRCK
jgi:hypothetical protein